MASVFISYRRQPSAMLANLIARELRGHNIEVYLDTERMDTAGDFPTRLRDAIQQHDVFICLVADTTLESDWVQQEILTAHKLGKPMIPVFQESYNPLAPRDTFPPHLQALLEHDGVLIFDVKNVYIDQSMEFLARVIENTASWLRESPTETLDIVDESMIGVNIRSLAGQMFDKYQMIELAGSGGMGTVYRAHQPNLRRDVALKLLPPAIASEGGYKERFQREAQTAAALEHAHIVPVYDYGNHGGIYYVVMRLLTGGSLAQRLEHAEQTDGQLPSLAETVEVIKRLALALDYAHSRGVIHRDIKASNVMFDQQGSPFLVDFGIAKLVGSNTNLTGTGVTMGTPSYMAPEQWRGESVTSTTDQYALGVMTYTMITGRMPFEGQTPFALMHKHLNEPPTPPQIWRSELNEDIKTVLDTAMAKAPRDRFPSVTAFADALATAVQTAPGEPTAFFTRPLPKPEVAAPVSATPASSEQVAAVKTNPPAAQTTFTDGDMPQRRLSTPQLIGLGIIGGIVVIALVAILLNQGGGGAAVIQNLPTMTPTTEVPTEQATVTSEPTDAPPATPATPVVVVQRNLTVRGGPGAQYPTLGTLDAAVDYMILGISDDGLWYQVELTDGSPGWVTASSALVQTAGDLAAVPIAQAPTDTPVPTATTTPTFTASPTPTNTLTATVTASLTPTPSLTATATFTVTATPSQTSTSTVTRTRTFTPTPTDTATATATNTPTLTRTATPTIPFVEALRDVVLRAGPGSQYMRIGVLNAGDRLDILGVSEDGGWYQVFMPTNDSAWIASGAALVRTAGNLTGVPIAQAPTASPTVRLPATATPTNTVTRTLPPPPTIVSTPTRVGGVVNCEGALPSRLIPGQRGFVRDDDPLPVNVRSGPGTTFARVAQMTIRSTFDVEEGPVCAQSMAWYRITTSNRVEGWIAEGDVTYFVDPLTSSQPTPTEAPVTQFNRVLAPTCNVITQDEFTDGVSANDWFIDERPNIQSNERIIDDFYEISLNFLPPGRDEATSWGSLRGPNLMQLGNVRVEAVMAATNWDRPGTRTGLWLRYQDELNFMAFMISSTGSYRIARFERDYASLQDWTATDAIRLGNGAINTVRVDMHGSQYDLYINGRFITSVFDDTWASGRVAFWGSSSILPNRFLLDYIRICAN